MNHDIYDITNHGDHGDHGDSKAIIIIEETQFTH